MAIFKRSHLFQTIILGIHLSFRGSTFLTNDPENERLEITLPLSLMSWKGEKKKVVFLVVVSGLSSYSSANLTQHKLFQNVTPSHFSPLGPSVSLKKNSQ